MRKVDSKEAYEIVMAGGEVQSYNGTNGKYRYVDGKHLLFSTSDKCCGVALAGPALDRREGFNQKYAVTKEPPAQKPEREVSGWAALAVLRAGGEVTQRESNRTYFWCQLYRALRVRRADSKHKTDFGNPTPKTICSIDGFLNGYTVSKEPPRPTAAECNDHIAAGGEVISTGNVRSIAMRYFGKYAQMAGGDPFDSPYDFSFSGQRGDAYLDITAPKGQRSMWFGGEKEAESVVETGFRLHLGLEKKLHFGRPAGMPNTPRDRGFVNTANNYPQGKVVDVAVDLLAPKERKLVEALRALPSYKIPGSNCRVHVDAFDRLAPPPPPTKTRRKCSLGEAVDALLAKKIVFRNGAQTGYTPQGLAALHAENVLYEIEEG